MSLVEIPGGLWSSAPSNLIGTSDGYTLDATGKRIALVFRIETAGELESVEFKPGTDLAINAASVIRASFQNVNTAGDPDATQDEFRDMVGSSLSSGLWKATGIISSDGTDTGTKRTVARGDVVALVFQYQSFTAADVFSIRELQAAAETQEPKEMPLPQAPYADVFGGASWVHGGQNPMSIALKYADGTFAYLGPGVVPIDAGAVLLVNDGFHANDEVGLVFKLPMEATLRGIRFVLRVFSAGASWDARVYNDVDTQIGQSEALGAGVSTQDDFGGAYRILTADVPLEANRWYRATVRALSGSTSAEALEVMRYQVDKIEHLGVHPGGLNFYSTRRNNGGLWTDEQTIRPGVDLHFSHLADVAGGSPGGGSGAPGRGFFRGGVS